MEQELDYSSYLKLINNCDPNEPLLSETLLGKRLEHICIAQIQLNDLNQMLQALNLEQLIRSNNGLARDYRGLAELMGFSSIEIETRFKRSYNPTKSLIDAYISKKSHYKNENYNDAEQFNLNELLKMIERLERFDIIDDYLPTLVKLASIHQHDHEKLVMKMMRGKNNKNDRIDKKNDNYIAEDLERLTIDDSSKFKAHYDAFICFAPEDFRHAEGLICLLERSGKHVATADDLLPGHFEHEALVQLIDIRCRKILIILTSNFLQSEECKIQLKFASEIAIRCRSPKIIPVLFEICDDSSLPYMIRVLSKIDMTNRQAHEWQLRKLLHSLDYTPEGGSSSPHIQYRSAFSRGNNDQLDQQPWTNAIITSTVNDTIDSNRQASTIDCTGTQQDEHKLAISNDNLEPIIDLAHSQCLSIFTSPYNSSNTINISENGNLKDNSFARSNQIEQHRGESTTFGPSVGSTNKPMDWFRQVRKKVLGCQTVASEARSSMRSKACLIPKDSEESVTSGFEKISEDGPEG